MKVLIICYKIVAKPNNLITNFFLFKDIFFSFLMPTTHFLIDIP